MPLEFSEGALPGDPINDRMSRKLRATGLYADFAHATGSVLTDTSGRTVLDMVPGHGALPLGHGPTSVTQAVAGVMDTPGATLVQPYFTDIVHTLARRLMTQAPMVTEQVNLATTGAEAVEIALNSARLVTGRLRFIAAVNGAHGKSIGALSVTHTRADNDFAELAGTIFVPFGDAEAVEQALKAEGDKIAGVILEPVQCEGGLKVAPNGYFDRVRSLCDSHGALLIHDEQMSGLGRTGHLFATEWTGGNPDILILGEALGGGAMPVSACLLGPRAVSDSLDFQQLSLFAGNAYAATAAHAFLDALQENDCELMRRVRQSGARLTTIHKRLQARFPGLIKDVRGVGLMQGFEIAPCPQVIAGSEGAFLQLAHAGDQYPFLMMGHMLSNGVRVTPAANTVNVLRLLPSLNVTDEECDTYGAALETCLDALAAQDTVRATKHVTGATMAARIETAVEFTGAEPVGSIGADEGRFGFIVHQLEIDDLQNLDPVLRQVTREQRHLLTEMLGQFDEPLVLSRARITGSDGATAVGDFILLPRSAQQLLNMPGDEAVALVQKAVTLAVRRGARIVGLGGYTSVVTRGGQLIDPLGAAVTTGNGFTIEAALMAVDYACTVLGRDQTKSTAAIIGAAGSIGNGLVQMISARARRLYLFLNPATPMEKSVRRLRHSVTSAIEAGEAGELDVMPGSLLSRALPMLKQGDSPSQLAARLLEDPGFFVLSTSCAKDLHNADVVYSATSSTERLINPEDLRAKSVVCDLSRPGNISFRCREERDDVLLMDGGVIAYPGRPELALGIPMPRGVAFACIAETVMLAIRKHYRNTSVGASPSPREITMLRGIAAETGFALADLRAFDKPIGRVDWTGLIDEPTRSEATGTEALSRVSAPADPRSISGEAMIDYYERLVGMRALGTERDDPSIIAADGTVYSWSQLHCAAGNVAGYLRGLGVEQGMRVLLAARGNFEHIACLAGLWRIGAAPVVLDVDLPSAILSEMVHSARPVLCLHAPGAGLALDGLLPMHPIPTAAALLSSDVSAPASVCLRAASEAFVIFTSGSTGAPKAVSHSLRDLVNMAENYGRCIAGLSPLDRVLVTSKLYYSYGMSVSMTALYCGASLLLGTGRFEPGAILDQIVNQRATAMFSVPTIYSILLKQPEREITNLRLCIAAGEPSSVFVGDAWERLTGVAIQDGLGTTEIMSFACATPVGERGGRSVGKVTPGFEIELRNAQGHVTRIGEAGVAWVRGNTQANGYIANPNPKAEAGAFVDGWYCTNDLMRMDDDGYLYYLARASDTIKVGGVWMSPIETERFLARHPLVAECAVVLREHPEPLVRPYAFVVLADGVPATSRTEARIRADLAACHARSQVPHKIFFLEKLPRSGNGKVQRFALASRVQDYLSLEHQE